MRYTKENNKGQALIIVLLLGIVVLILVMSITSNVTKNAQQNNENYNGQLAFTAAQTEAQNGINSINTNNQSNGDIPLPVSSLTPQKISCNNVIPTASGSKNNCQYTNSYKTLAGTTTVNLAYGVMLPINLITSPTSNFSGTLYFNISGSSGQLQVIYMTGSSGSETMKTCLTSTNGSYSLPLTNASVVYLELLGSNGGTVIYSSNSLPGVHHTLGGCD